MAALSVVLEAGLLLSLHLCNTHQIVVVVELVGTTTEGKHTSLNANSLDLCSVELITASRQLGPVNVLRHVHLSTVDPQDICTSLLVGDWELNLAVQTTRAKQRRIQN